MKRFLFLLFIIIHSISTFGQTYVLDSLFNGNGRERLSWGYYSEISDCIVQPDDKVIIVALSYDIPGSHYFLSFCRINADGTRDYSFGSNGFGITNIDMGISSNTTPYQMKPTLNIDNSNRIIVVNAAKTPIGTNTDFFICRLTNAGLIDSTFNSTGSKYVDLTGSSICNDVAFAVDIDVNDNIYVAGFTRLTPSEVRLSVVKLIENGSLDTSFNSNGKIVRTLLPNINEVAQQVLVQPDGKILLGISVGFNAFSYLYRIDSTGNYDSTFNGTGTLPIYFGTSSSMEEMALDSLNNIIVVANTMLQNGSIGVARILPSGIFDSSFGIGGSTVLQLNNYRSWVGDLKIVSGNQIIICGSVQSPSGKGVAIARINSSGELDTLFNSNGYFLDHFNDIALGSDDDKGNTLSMLSDGRIFVGGSYQWFPPHSMSKDIGMLMIKPQIPTGIQSIDGNKQIVLFPNPAKNNITISTSDNLNVIVVDMLGKTVLHAQLQRGDNELNIESLNPGLYFIVDTNSNLKLKFIKE